jgi:hypothetical protein
MLQQVSVVYQWAERLILDVDHDQRLGGPAFLETAAGGSWNIALLNLKEGD